MNAVATPDYPETPLEHALAYAALGFRVFPLHSVADCRCTCGDGDCRSAGKHPRTPNGARDATVDADVLRTWWQQWPTANVGMTLEGYGVVDMDPRNDGEATLDALQAQHGKLPDTAMALTGGGGEHYLYRLPDDRRLPGKLGHGVDFKSGRNAYIVVAPSIHASGVAYTWEASSDLLDGHPVAMLPEWIGAQAAPLAPALGQKVVGFMDAKRKRDLRGAMAYLPADDRDTWVRVGMALKSTDAKEAFGLWTEWSQRSEKYDPRDQTRVWNSFKSDGGLNVETVFAMAADNGWQNTGMGIAAEEDDKIRRLIEAANTPTEVQLHDPGEGGDIGPFPAPKLNDLADWITSRYDITHPAVTRQIVLSIAAMVASRVYVGEGGTPCHLCLGVVSESSAITAYAKDAVAQVLDAAGLQRMMRGTQARSQANIYLQLWRSPSSILVVNDFGHLAKYAQRQPSGQLDQTFAAMAEIHTAHSIKLDSAADIGLSPGQNDEQLVIHEPALTSLLLSTHAQMGVLMQRDQISRGLLAWQLPVIAKSSEAREGVPSRNGMSGALRDHMRAVRRLPSGESDMSLQDIFGAQPGLQPRVTQIRYECSFDEHARAIRGLSDNDNHRVVLMTAVNTAKRLVNCLAPWRDPAAPVATREIMDWATGYVMQLMRSWLDEYDTLGNEDGIVGAVQQVVKTVGDRKTEGMRRGKLHCYCRAYKRMDKEKREKVLAMALEDGDLIEYTPPGQRAKVLVHRKFATRVTKGKTA